MIYAPVGQQEFPGVSARVHLRPAEVKDADPHVSITFQAKADDGTALKEQFQGILDGAKENMKDGPYGHMVGMFDLVKVANDDDKVHIIVNIPPPPPQDGEG